MKRLTPELAADRRLTLKCWVMLTLPSAEVVEILRSATPPTIGELVARARKRATEYAGRCQHCGEPVLCEPSRYGEKAGEMAADGEVFTPTKVG
jgi:hypothetical protein